MLSHHLLDLFLVLFEAGDVFSQQIVMLGLKLSD
jgi:hypothetical protein